MSDKINNKGAVSTADMETVLTAMKDPHGFLERVANGRGIKLYKLCAQSGIDPSHITRWKVRPPKTAETISKILEDTINK